MGNESIKDINDYNSPEINNNDCLTDSMNLEMDKTNQKTSLKTKKAENESNNEIFKEQIDNNINSQNENIYNGLKEFPSFIPNIKNNFEDINLNQNYYNENNSKKEGDKKLSIEIKNNIEINNNKNEAKSQFGRKTYEDKKIGKKGLHTKDSEDNIIYKIKSFFWKSLYQFIKSSFIEKKDLLKLTIDVNKKLKKDYNEKLFNKKLKYLFMNTEISIKYKHKDPSTNKMIISQVYKEKKEIAVMKILDLTYIEAFNIFRRELMNQEISSELKMKIEETNFLDRNKFQDARVFLEKIENQLKKNKEKEEDIIEYKNMIKHLILNLENWFSNKVGRNR